MSWFFPIIVWLFLVLDFVAYIKTPIKIRTSYWAYKWLPSGGVIALFQHMLRKSQNPK